MKLKTFRKGIHPAEHKGNSQYRPLERMPLPKEVFIPLQQHIGAPCKAVVDKKADVRTGQVIGESAGFVSSRIHATISGKVKTVDPFLHPLGVPAMMVNITGDNLDTWVDADNPHLDWETLSAAELITQIQSAGIVGLGGAAFPTHVKLQPPKTKTIDTLIINGCECEPFLTADHRMMIEQTDDLITGIHILMKALNVRQALIGIESNKPDAIEILQTALQKDDTIRVVPLKVKYPQGAEKMLIEAVLKRAVPTGGLPMDVGVVVNNVGTAIAVAEAVVRRKPLIERVVTVTGDGIQQPKNLIVRIGTPFQEVIDFCGGLTGHAVKVIMGGPMMGVTLPNLNVPVIKATSGILCLTEAMLQKEPIYPCIQCGGCIHACPMRLVPTRLARATEIGNYELAEQLGILNCIECGSCAYTCPSRIPLVQWLRVGKFRVNEMRRKRQLAAAI